MVCVHVRLDSLKHSDPVPGNFGQANYSAAKMGLVGFTKEIAAEGTRYGIKAMVVAQVCSSNVEVILSLTVPMNRWLLTL